MNSKEIILKALRLEKTTRVPVAILSGGAWAFNRKGLTLEKALKLEPDEAAGIIAQTNDIVGSDIVWAGSGYHNLAIRAIGGKIKFRQKGTPDIEEVLLKDASSINYKSLDDINADQDINMLVKTTESLNKAVGNRTLVGASQWGPFTLAGHVYGVERLMRNIYKDKKSVHEVLEFTTELCYRYLELFVKAGAEIISVADPTSSGDLISREQFREFSLPYLKKVVSKLGKIGGIVSIHICGDITNRLDLIPDTGAKNISLDYKVNLKTAKELIGGKIAFSGNMNPVAIMQNELVEGVEAACRSCIESVGKKQVGYILMPGCDVPPSVPIENLVKMVETAKSISL